jgi:hypothetical protein
VVGGYAFAIHAFPRFTNDIDFFIHSTKSNVNKIVSVLNKFGFDNASFTSDDFLIRDRVIQLGEPPYRIDILTSIDGVNFEDAWKNRIKGNYGNQILYFISKEDLIKNKKASGRKKDLDDLSELES